MPLLDNLGRAARVDAVLTARIHALHAAVAEAGGRRYDRYLTRAESEEAGEQVVVRAAELEAWLLRVEDQPARPAPISGGLPDVDD